MLRECQERVFVGQNFNCFHHLTGSITKQRQDSGLFLRNETPFSCSHQTKLLEQSQDNKWNPSDTDIF